MFELYEKGFINYVENNARLSVPRQRNDGFGGRPDDDDEHKRAYRKKVLDEFAPKSKELYQMFELYEKGFKNYEENKEGLKRYGIGKYLNMMGGR